LIFEAKENKMNSNIREVALRFALIVKNSTNSHGKPNTHVKRSDVIAVLIYEFAGTDAIGAGRSVTREFMTSLAEAVGGTYELNPARIVFTR
jgi:hypothetical protein